ncbi:MAG: hypothetical protein JWN77_2169, partial [Frankiales bacterium]|nr:hypothetical protein [Frankiales bacterium]
GSPVPVPSVQVASPPAVDATPSAAPPATPDDVPLPLAGFAGALVLALGSSVAVASRRR